jgi:hypothetical protein
MNTIKLNSYVKESGKSFSDIARLTGSTRQRVHHWSKYCETLVHCQEDFSIDKIEIIKRKTVYAP